MILKYFPDKKERKIFIINILLFVIIIFSFSQLNTYLHEINFELQYKDFKHYQNYGIKDSDIKIENDSIKIKDYSEKLNIGFEVLIPLIIGFILIIENIFSLLSILKEKINSQR